MVKIIYDNGIPFIEIAGERFSPAAFRSFRPRPDNVRLAHRAGIRLFQILVSGLNCVLDVPYSLYGGVWKGEGSYDRTAFTEPADKFAHND